MRNASLGETTWSRLMPCDHSITSAWRIAADVEDVLWPGFAGGGPGVHPVWPSMLKYISADTGSARRNHRLSRSNSASRCSRGRPGVRYFGD